MIDVTLENNNDEVNRKRLLNESVPNGDKRRKEGKCSEPKMKRRMNGEIIWGIEENRKKLVSQSIEKKEKWGRLDSQKM